jgi:hypothetical protein
MLTLIIEILLTIKAWRKGWRGYALLPLGALLIAGFLLGIVIGSSGGDLGQALPAGLFLEIACIGILIRLAAKGPSPALVLSLNSKNQTITTSEHVVVN